jgi:exosortase H (IPTLxxWG-CTERM-specific)
LPLQGANPVFEKVSNTAPRRLLPWVNPGSVRFLLLFGAILGGYYALTVIPWVDRNLIYPVLEFTARTASWLMNLAGGETMVNGITIQGPVFAVRVQRGCDPLDPMVLFGAAVFAFPSKWKQKGPGLLIGSATLLLLNQVRIISLYLVGRSHAEWFYSFHQEWWPAGFVLAAIALWLGWLQWAGPREGHV